MVCGLCSKATQKKLLTENDLTLKKALDVAQNKMASVRAKQLQSPITARDQEKYVYKVTSAHSQRLQRVRRLLGNTCYCCGKPDHKNHQCKYKDYTCNNCGQTGHLRCVCSKLPMKKPTNTSKRKAGEKAVADLGGVRGVQVHPPLAASNVFL